MPTVTGNRCYFVLHFGDPGIIHANMVCDQQDRALKLCLGKNVYPDVYL